MFYVGSSSLTPKLPFRVVKRFNYFRQKKWRRYFDFSVGRFWMAQHLHSEMPALALINSGRRREFRDEEERSLSLIGLYFVGA